jgi:hypothetical protein
MKKILTGILLLVIGLPLFAVENGQVQYVGGTVPALAVNAVGKLDLTSQTVMQFESSKGKFSVPYASIDSYEYTQELTHHLGVLPAIGVGLTRTRKHRHYFRIVYQGENNVSQIVVIEVSKHMPPVLQAVLKARAPHAVTLEPDGRNRIAGMRTDNCNCQLADLTAQRVEHDGR